MDAKSWSERWDVEMAIAVVVIAVVMIVMRRC